MQKFSTWLDSFPKIKPKSKLRSSLKAENASSSAKKQNLNSKSFFKRTFRRSERETTKKSDSFRAPKVSTSWEFDSPPKSKMCESFEAISCRYQEMHASPFLTPEINCYTLPLPPNRPHIRTNPWFSRSPVPGGQKPPVPSALDLWKDTEVQELCRPPSPSRSTENRESTGANRQTKPSFLDESMCSSNSSSGYGSQDSSPESSVHTPDWQRLSEQYDKLVAICDNMVTSVTVRSSDKAVICSEEDFESELESDISECDYCILKSSCKTDQNGNPLRTVPRFHAPPPPPLSSLKRSETLTQSLNTKMGTLKEKNLNLKASIKRAKEEREKKLKEKQVCLEKIQFLRDLKWVIQGNFEIAL